MSGKYKLKTNIKEYENLISIKFLYNNFKKIGISTKRNFVCNFQKRHKNVDIFLETYSSESNSTGKTFLWQKFVASKFVRTF